MTARRLDHRQGSQLSQVSPVRVAVVTGPRIAIGPRPWDGLTAAVREAGGEPAGIGPDADALVWLDAADLEGLTRALAAAPAARWVQLPYAGVELPSEPVVTGAVQVPANGRPVVFLADHPTTGGYPVVGVVPAQELATLAQVRPGTVVRLRPVG